VRFETASGSVYEVDRERRRVRRLRGEEPAAHRLGHDAWKAYELMSPVIAGEPVVFAWSVIWASSEEALAPATVTSPVRRILDPCQEEGGDGNETGED